MNSITKSVVGIAPLQWDEPTISDYSDWENNPYFHYCTSAQVFCGVFQVQKLVRLDEITLETRKKAIADSPWIAYYSFAEYYNEGRIGSEYTTEAEAKAACQQYWEECLAGHLLYQ
jgi:hypothetical protein